jgi:hypothetical protein
MGIREKRYEDVALLHVARNMALWPAVSKPVLPTFNFRSVFGFTEVGCNRGEGVGGVRVKCEAETRKKNISTLVLTVRMGVVKKSDKRVGSVGKVSHKILLSLLL